MPAPPPGRPATYERSHILHYYGNMIRGFLLGGAVLLIMAPVVNGVLPGGLPAHLTSVAVLILLAALTTPQSMVVMALDCVAAAIMFGFAQMRALENYSADAFMVFAVRQAVASVFLSAFYFGVKTLRAMRLHQIGRRPRPREFDNA